VGPADGGAPPVGDGVGQAPPTVGMRRTRRRRAGPLNARTRRRCSASSEVLTADASATPAAVSSRGHDDSQKGGLQATTVTVARRALHSRGSQGASRGQPLPRLCRTTGPWVWRSLAVVSWRPPSRQNRGRFRLLVSRGCSSLTPATALSLFSIHDEHGDRPQGHGRRGPIARGCPSSAGGAHRSGRTQSSRRRHARGAHQHSTTGSGVGHGGQPGRGPPSGRWRGAARTMARADRRDGESVTDLPRLMGRSSNTCDPRVAHHGRLRTMALVTRDKGCRGRFRATFTSTPGTGRAHHSE
jgi:hypothetical protein